MSFPRYAEYVDSGVEWLEASPSNWGLFLGKRLFKQRKEKAYPRDEQLAASQAFGVVPQKKMMTLTGNKVMLALGGTDTFRHVEENDFVISLRSFEGGIEHSAYTGCVSPAYTVLTSIHTVVPLFYKYLFKSRPYIAALQASTDSLRDGKSITFEQFGAIPLPNPSISEQTQIARFLDHETAKIDALIAEQKRLIKLLQEKLHSLILSDIKNHNLPEERLQHLVDVVRRPVTQLPDEDYVALGLFNRGRGLFHKPAKKRDEMGDSDFFWIKQGDLIISGQFAWEGAVAMATELETGKVVSHRYPVIRGRRGGILTEYLFALLTTSHGDFLLNENSRGAAGRNRPLNLNSLLKEKVKIPSISKQELVANLVHRVNQIKLETQMQKELLLERRSTLISAVVTGKIDVRGWLPPSDESASDEEVQKVGLEASE